MTITSNDIPGKATKESFSAAHEGKKAQSAQADKPAAAQSPRIVPAGDNAPALTTGIKGPPLC